jgi:hypothetical protein
MLTNNPRRTVLTGLVASALLAFAGATNASAAEHSCAKRGATVAYSNPTYVTLRKKVRGKDWEEGPFKIYACSRAYGKVVYVGEEGLTPDGPEWVYVSSANSRYVALVSGYGGNADGGQDNAVYVKDLKTGKTVSDSRPTTTDDGFEPSVASVSLAADGSVAWIVNFTTETKVGTDIKYEQRLELRARRARGEKVSMLVASGKSDVTFLSRWSADSKRLIWTNAPKVFSYTPRKERKSEPLRHGGCVGRSGDKLIGRGYGYLYLSRPFKADGWSHGRVLIACSLKYKRRVAIGHSGTYGGAIYSFDAPTVNETFAAITSRVTDADQKATTTVMVYDLGRDERICRTDVGGALANVKVTPIALDGSGAAAWIFTGDTNAATGAPPTAAGAEVCDDKSARVLSQDEHLDEGLLKMDDYNKQIRVAISPSAT